MSKTEILDTLFGARDRLSDMIIDLKPTADHKPLLQKLVQRRDLLTGAIGQLIRSAFDEASANLADSLAALEKQTDVLTGLSNTLDQVAVAIQVTDQIVQLVMSVVKLAAA